MKDRVVIIDGNSLVNQAFFATRYTNMMNKDGVPTNAVYGFANMMLKIRARSSKCANEVIRFKSLKLHSIDSHRIQHFLENRHNRLSSGRYSSQVAFCRGWISVVIQT